MSQLSEERIEEIALEFKVKTMLVQAVKKAVEKEAAIYWQERMRERAKKIPYTVGLSFTCQIISAMLSNLEIEEPK